MNRCLVSIIVPMYNSELYIEDTIKSVIEQSYDNWELLIIDDCSTDNSLNIVDMYQSKDNRIRLIKQESNEGPAKSRQRGINEAKGKYIAFLDSDDIWMSNKLKTQVGYMEVNNIPVTCTSYKINSENLEVTYGDFIVPTNIDYKTLLKQNYFSCNTVMINQEKVGKIKMINYDKHEDYITWLNLMKIVENAHGIQEVLSVYRLRKASRSTGKFKSVLKMWEIYRNKENINIYLSIYYTINYIIRGTLKYRKALNMK